MFNIIYMILKFSINILVALIGYASFSDFFGKTYYLDGISHYIIKNPYLILLIGVVSFVYILIILLSYIEKLFKKPKSIKSKGENGEIEVTTDTINTITKGFLEGQEIVKFAKTSSYSSFSKIVVKASLDIYTVEDLSNKLKKIQDDLIECVEMMTGLKVKTVVLKVVKVIPETVIEKTVIKNGGNVEIIGDDIEDDINEASELN